MENTQKQALIQRLDHVPDNTIQYQQCGGQPDPQKNFSVEATGKGEICSYSVYPGIFIFFLDLLTDCAVLPTGMGSVLVIQYCRYGRLEWEMQDSGTLYLGPGDFSIHVMEACADSSIALPAEYYQGLMIHIDLDIFSANLPEPLWGTGISGESLSSKFCAGHAFGYFPGNEQTKGIFDSLFGLPENLQGAYFKVKILELLLYLYRLPANRQKNQYQAEQVETMKEIHAYLMENLDQRITIEMLSKKYLMNTTTLKELFKTVYGVSIATHMKEHRMEKAAALLRESNEKIEEIARLVGYESQSKFTAAFKCFYELTPLEYRKNYSLFSE